MRLDLDGTLVGDVMLPPPHDDERALVDLVDKLREEWLDEEVIWGDGQCVPTTRTIRSTQRLLKTGGQRGSIRADAGSNPSEDSERPESQRAALGEPYAGLSSFSSRVLSRMTKRRVSSSKSLSSRT